MSKSSKKIGLALGSGAARGWAHIGVINALEELGVKADCVAGTSIGALVGSAYAGGKLSALEDIVKRLDKRMLMGFIDPGFSNSGLIDGHKLEEFIRENVEIGEIDDLEMEFRAVSTDILRGKEVVLDKGDVIRNIRASISMPGIFTPVRREDAMLVDGALVNPLPVSVTRDMGADFVIAVDVNYGTQELPRVKDKKEPKIRSAESKLTEDDSFTPDTAWEKVMAMLGENVARIEHMLRSRLDGLLELREVPNIFEVLLASYNILEVQVTEMRLKYEPPDVLLRPDCACLGFLDLDKAKIAIDEGYRCAMDHKDEFPVESK